MRFIFAGLASLAGIYLVILLLVFIFQRQFLYFPDQSVPPASYLDQMDVESVVIRSDADGDLRSLWHEPKAPDSPVILLLHGNAGSHFHRIPIYRALASDGAAVLGVGYPGYGGNIGSANESELFQTAQENYDWLIQKGIKPDRIIIIGESLGSGVAAYLASQNDAAGLIMVAAYTGMNDMAQRQFPFFPAGWLVKDRYRTIDRIDSINMPLTWIHGTEDELIPFAMGKSFFNAAKNPKTAFPIKDAGHNDLWDKGIDKIIRGVASKLVTGVITKNSVP